MALAKLMLTAAAASLALAACNKQEAKPEGSATAAEAAGANTIASDFGNSSKFAAAVKAAGLDATLAGPGPYTVLVPSDDAFAKLPGGTLDALMKDDARSQLTAVLSYHILPGTILSADIAKAIEDGKGKALLPTMGGGTITATKEGDAIVLTDGAGTKARIDGTDEQRSNGVIHRTDGVLMPS